MVTTSLPQPLHLHHLPVTTSPSLSFSQNQTMWRSTPLLIFRSILAVHPTPLSPARNPIPLPLLPSRLLSTTAPSSSPAAKGADEEADSVTVAEARRLMRLVNVESLKKKMEVGGEEVIRYDDLLRECQQLGVARNSDEARGFVKTLDEAGVVLLFRDKVYLHPEKVVDLMKKVVPLALTPENDPRRQELKELQKKKEHIDMLAHRQVRRILWSGLGFFICQVGIFFRLTFWEFSWDVMEPIAFFTTTTGLIIGYAYFLFTSRDPTYQDLMKRLFLSRQRRLIQKHNFDIDRFMELQNHCKCPLGGTDGQKFGG